MLDLLAAGKMQPHGFIRQEDVPLQLFLENRFGKVYARPGQTLLPAQVARAER